MAAIRFFTDEDIHGSLAPALRRAGVVAVSTPEANRLGESDESQLHWSTSQGFVFVTFNVADFARRHFEWVQNGESHSGIVVSQQRPIGDALRRLLHLANSLDAEIMKNRLEFLGDW